MKSSQLYINKIIYDDLIIHKYIAYNESAFIGHLRYFFLGTMNVQ